jgi:TRAP-type C4-dicarboxylate transport system permease small subunit
MREVEHGKLLRWRRWDEVIATAALCVIVFSVTWGVISRYILPQPATWTYEIATLAFAWLVFFGAIAGVRLGTHAAIDILVDALPIRFRVMVAWFNYVLIAILFATLAVLFLQQAVLNLDTHTVALHLSRAWYYGPLSVASAGLFVQHLFSDRPWRRETLERHADAVI